MNYLARKLILAHSRQASIEGKCLQGQYPWHDGICSCGKWGEQEEHIEEAVNKIFDGDALALEELKREIERQEEIRKEDELLLGVEDLSDRLWGSR